MGGKRNSKKSSACAPLLASLDCASRSRIYSLAQTFEIADWNTFCYLTFHISDFAIIGTLVYVVNNKIFVLIDWFDFLYLVDCTCTTQIISRKLPSVQENVCMAVRDSGSMYAVGCRSYTLLLDSRTIQAIKKIPSRYSGCGKFHLEGSSSLPINYYNWNYVLNTIFCKYLEPPKNKSQCARLCAICRIICVTLINLSCPPLYPAQALMICTNYKFTNCV